MANCARSQAIIQLRDVLPSYAKHIGHFALNPNFSSYPCAVSSNHACMARCTSLLRQTHWQRCLKSKFSNYSCLVSSNHAIARCTSFIRQTHLPLCLKSKFSSYSCSVSSNHAIARCTSFIRQTHWELCLKSKVSSYSCSVSSNHAMRDALLSNAKHIGHFAVIQIL